MGKGTALERWVPQDEALGAARRPVLCDHLEGLRRKARQSTRVSCRICDCGGAASPAWFGAIVRADTPESTKNLVLASKNLAFWSTSTSPVRWLLVSCCSISSLGQSRRLIMQYLCIISHTEPVGDDPLKMKIYTERHESWLHDTREVPSECKKRMVMMQN
jgi:hypothetical protein